MTRLAFHMRAAQHGAGREHGSLPAWRCTLSQASPAGQRMLLDMFASAWFSPHRSVVPRRAVMAPDGATFTWYLPAFTTIAETERKKARSRPPTPNLKPNQAVEERPLPAHSVLATCGCPRSLCRAHVGSSLVHVPQYSPTFRAGGHAWRLLIFPRGNNHPHLAAYLDAADTYADEAAQGTSGWSRHAWFRLTLVNRDPRRNLFLDADHTFCARHADCAARSRSSHHDADPAHTRGWTRDAHAIHASHTHTNTARAHTHTHTARHARRANDTQPRPKGACSAHHARGVRSRHHRGVAKGDDPRGDL
jgi:hypothetical protein